MKNLTTPGAGHEAAQPLLRDWRQMNSTEPSNTPQSPEARQLFPSPTQYPPGYPRAAPGVSVLLSLPSQALTASPPSHQTSPTTGDSLHKGHFLQLSNHQSTRASATLLLPRLYPFLAWEGPKHSGGAAQVPGRTEVPANCLEVFKARLDGTWSSVT